MSCGYDPFPMLGCFKALPNKFEAKTLVSNITVGLMSHHQEISQGRVLEHICELHAMISKLCDGEFWFNTAIMMDVADYIYRIKIFVAFEYGSDAVKYKLSHPIVDDLHF
jgi:hypothetical protein